MKTQKTITASYLIAALFFVILPFGSANAKEIMTAQDHVQIAKHHEALLREAEAKLKEHKVALEDYESRPYYYGRRGQEFQSHETANNKAQAALHYKLAGESQTPKFMRGNISISKTQTN
jgi:hypothetical protein